MATLFETPRLVLRHLGETDAATLHHARRHLALPRIVALVTPTTAPPSPSSKTSACVSSTPSACLPRSTENFFCMPWDDVSLAVER